jgi:hypothetical protein
MLGLVFGFSAQSLISSGLIAEGVTGSEFRTKPGTSEAEKYELKGDPQVALLACKIPFGVGGGEVVTICGRDRDSGGSLGENKDRGGGVPGMAAGFRAVRGKFGVPGCDKAARKISSSGDIGGRGGIEVSAIFTEASGGT